MKIKNLLLSAATCFALSTQAQIHPASMWSNTFVYDAIPHVHEAWSASGYTLSNINMTKDANGYITSINTSTPPPFNTSMDQYRSTGSYSSTTKTFTASTQKQLKSTTLWFNWRNETWQSDGTNDTAMFWQDSIGGAWTNVIKHVLHYNGSVPDYVTDYNWVGNTWTVVTKMTMTFVAGKRDKFTNYNWIPATSTWKQYGVVQYYYSSKLDSLLSWATDTAGVNTIKQKYYFTTDGVTGKTTSFTAYDWDATNSKWKAGVTIIFDNTLFAVREIAQSNNETINVYPTPADNILKVDFVNSNPTKIHIKDIVGKEIYSGELSRDHSEINTSEMKNGIYILTTAVEGKIIEQRKIIIAH